MASEQAVYITPKAKISLTDQLIEILFHDKIKQLKQELAEILTANYDLTSTPISGRTNKFNYKGIPFIVDKEFIWYPINTNTWAKKSKLDESLFERMENYLQEKELLDSYKNPVKGFIRKVLSTSVNYDDLYLLLPADLQTKIYPSLKDYMGADYCFRTLSDKEIERFNYETKAAQSRIYEFFFIEKHLTESEDLF